VHRVIKHIIEVPVYILYHGAKKSGNGHERGEGTNTGLEYWTDIFLVFTHFLVIRVKI